MMEVATKIELMCTERAELRDEIIEMQRSMHKVVFTFCDSRSRHGGTLLQRPSCSQP